MPEPMPATLWAYRARAVRVIDGDTVEVVADLGFGAQLGHDPRLPLRLRLLRVNAPERKGATRAAGEVAKAYVEVWFSNSLTASEWPLVIRTQKPDSLGRYLAEVWRQSDGRNLSDDLLTAGHALPYED